MTNDKSWKSRLIKEKNSLVENDFDDLEEKHVEQLASFTESDNQEVRSEAIIVINKISKKDPVQLLPVAETIVEVAQDESEHTGVRMAATMTIKNMKEDSTVQNLMSRFGVEKSDTAAESTSQDTRALCVAAKSSTVTESRLKGREAYFYDVTNFLKSDEQPHFLFALSHSWAITDGSVVVDKHGSDQVLLKRKNTGSVLVSNYGVRILSEGGRWTLPYQKITGTGTERRPTPTLKVMAAGEIYKMRVGKSIHDKSQVSRASKFIEQVLNS